MDCEKANALMFEYMDEVLSKEDASKLGEHLAVCEVCKADFAIYDQMMNGFMSMELVEAPAGFEDSVMQKIRELPPIHVTVNNAIDSIIYWVLGIFSIFLGVGFVGTIYSDSILKYVNSKPELYWFAQLSSSVSGYVERFTANFAELSTSVMATASTYASASRYVLLVVFVVLLGVQYVLYRKDKVEI